MPAAQLATLRDKILQLLVVFAPGPKPIRLQLCVCLATLAIQMKEWKDVLPTVVGALGNDVASHAAILDFLRVLPEEVTEGRKINLTVRGLAHQNKSSHTHPRARESDTVSEPPMKYRATCLLSPS